MKNKRTIIYYIIAIICLINIFLIAYYSHCKHTKYVRQPRLQDPELVTLEDSIHWYEDGN